MNTDVKVFLCAYTFSFLRLEWLGEFKIFFDLLNHFPKWLYRFIATPEACDSFSCTISSPLVAQMVNNLPAMQETWVPSLGWQNPLEEGMATHSSILAWRIPMDRGAWWATVPKSQTQLSD